MSLHNANAWPRSVHGEPASAERRSAQSSPFASTRSQCIRFCVSVPVLSEQMKVTEPRVSTAGRLRTRLCRRLSLRAPSASDTVITAGSASGIAATARLTAVSAISINGCPCNSPDTNTTAQIASTAIAR